MNEIDLTESHRIELKQHLTDSLEKEVVAFLNYHEGGVIYIGVDAHGKVLGCEDVDDIQLKIKDRLKHNISPSCLGLSKIRSHRQDFFAGYSKPINRELMRIYKDLELVEHLGSGLGRILEFYGKDSFVVSQNFMKNVFYSSEKLPTAQAEAQDIAQANLTETEKKVLDNLKLKNLSSAELVERLELRSLSGALKNAIKHLLELELIELTIPTKPKSPNQKYKRSKK
ncbi:MAG: hypothetical protein QG565_30 [Campylobacterota bacterium]|nr:hypothetical protein [Campylobacterota bacterium]